MKTKSMLFTLSVLFLSLASASAFAATTTIKVTATGGKYYFDGQKTPTVYVQKGDTLIFDLSDPSLGKHPFYVTEEKDSNRTYYYSQYSSDYSELTLEITQDTPSVLYYSCTVHDNMGGEGSIQVLD